VPTNRNTTECNTLYTMPYARPMPGELDSIEDGIRLIRKVEWIARISHRAEDAQTETSWKKFVPLVCIERGDLSVIEHATVTADVMVDRGITHEWVRHRIGAYTQESTRFVNYEKKMPPLFVIPPGLCELGADQDTMFSDPRFLAWNESIKVAETNYKALLSAGCAPQIARSVFPNALASRLIVTYNLRSWRHFFLLRTTREAHPQMREVTIPLLAIFKERIPVIFDDIEPLAKQADNVRKPR